MTFGRDTVPPDIRLTSSGEKLVWCRLNAGNGTWERYKTLQRAKHQKTLSMPPECGGRTD